jgi:uncharacterized protein YdhG (YjbR/CyaY superfamily)
MAGRKKILADSGAVDKYISSSPEPARAKLERLRTLVTEAAPGATETTSYFEMPGYLCPGYDYNGMFAWFALKRSHIALYLRPQAIPSHRKELEDYERSWRIMKRPGP